MQPNPSAKGLERSYENTLERAGMSLTLYLGLPILSTKIALVLSSIAAAKASGVESVTHFTPMPKCLKVTMKMSQFHFGNAEVVARDL